jgi:hypothetical protein
MNITVPAQRTTTYQKSFFPQSINDWNSLNIQLRNSTSIVNFKDKQKATSLHKPNPLYHHNSSNSAINQTRMRLGLSALSSHRHDYNHIDDPKCRSCSGKIEDPIHYFLICPTYANARPTLMLNACAIIFKYQINVDFTNRRFCTFFVNTLLKGSMLLTLDDNKAIMNICRTFIRESHRFPWLRSCQPNHPLCSWINPTSYTREYLFNPMAIIFSLYTCFYDFFTLCIYIFLYLFLCVVETPKMTTCYGKFTVIKWSLN